MEIEALYQFKNKITMKKIIIYTKDICPYCTRAKNLLQRKGTTFQEIKVINDDIKNEMIKKSQGRLTVPQIFIEDFHVGGCDDLYALDSEGKLDELLK
jgi:glutaredoxin 3